MHVEIKFWQVKDARGKQSGVDKPGAMGYPFFLMKIIK